jgi:hypothetical protein
VASGEVEMIKEGQCPACKEFYIAEENEDLCPECYEAMTENTTCLLLGPGDRATVFRSDGSIEYYRHINRK